MELDHASDSFTLSQPQWAPNNKARNGWSEFTSLSARVSDLYQTGLNGSGTQTRIPIWTPNGRLGKASLTLTTIDRTVRSDRPPAIKKLIRILHCSSTPTFTHLRSRRLNIIQSTNVHES